MKAIINNTTIANRISGNNKISNNTIMKTNTVQSLANEIWKDLVGYEGYYEVSNLGRCKSLIRKGVPVERLIKATKNSAGYFRFHLSKDNNSKHLAVHRAVATTFIDNPEGKEQVNHIDGNKSNNNIYNLEWTTCSENISHGYKVNPSRTRMTNEIAKEIRLLSAEGLTQKEISTRLKVGVRSIQRVVKGEIFNKPEAHPTQEQIETAKSLACGNYVKGRAKLDTQDLSEIEAMITCSELSQTEIADIYSVSTSTISRIAKRIQS